MLELTDKKGLSDALIGLASKIKEQIELALTNKSIKPENETFLHNTVTEFNYTEKGINYKGSSHYITKKTWYMTVSHIVKEVEKYKEYLLIVKNFNVQESDLNLFINKLVSYQLNNDDLNTELIDKFVKLFIGSLLDEPLRCGADINLEGLFVIPKKIEFKIGDNLIILRQTKISDLEKDISMHDFLMYDKATWTPSAILHLEFLGTEPREIQNKVEQAIVILRLFKVGSVKYMSYTMFSDSITPFGSGTVSHINKWYSSEKYSLYEKDAQNLKNFWGDMINFMPKSFYDDINSDTDYLTISYKRYCDALIEIGTIEKRIATTIMSFESLFLKKEEQQENTFRLKIRVSKLLGKYGFEPIKIKRIIRDAYSIRNFYVHGGMLSYEDKSELEHKYGNLNELLKIILDYLRISILIMIFIRKNKPEFIDSIDNSLIDIEKDSQIENLLKNIKNLIPIN